MKRREIREKYEYPVNLLMDIYGENAIKDLYNGNIPGDFDESMNYILEHVGSKINTEILRLYWIEKKSAREISIIKGCTLNRIIQRLNESNRNIRGKFDYMIRVGMNEYNSDKSYAERIARGEKLKKSIFEKYNNISYLGLSTRTYMRCRRNNITKITDLQDMLKDGSIRKIWRIGKKSMIEIADAVHYDIRNDALYSDFFKDAPEEQKFDDFERKLHIKIESMSKFIDEDVKSLDDANKVKSGIDDLLTKLNDLSEEFEKENK